MNIVQVGMASTKTGDLKEMPLASQPVLTEKSVANQSPSPIGSVVLDVVAQGFEVVGEMPVGESPCDELVERVKEKGYCLLGKVNSYDMEKQKLEETLLNEQVETKPMTLSLADLERSVNRQQTERGSLMKTNKDSLSC